MDNDRLQQKYDDAGRPGAQAFSFAVRRAGLQISDTEAKEFVAKQSSGQIMQGRLRSDGVVPSGARDSSRAQADLIDFRKRIKRINKGHKYVFVVVALYDRRPFTVPMNRRLLTRLFRLGARSSRVTGESPLQKRPSIKATNGHY